MFKQIFSIYVNEKNLSVLFSVQLSFMYRMYVILSYFLTDAAGSELQVSSSRFQELETSYVTQKSEVINLAQKN